MRIIDLSVESAGGTEAEAEEGSISREGAGEIGGARVGVGEGEIDRGMIEGGAVPGLVI